MKHYARMIVAGALPLLIAAGSGPVAAQSRPDARSQIVGAWQLESRTVRTAGGDTLIDPVLGQQPIGRLFYDASGYMMLQMMRRDRTGPISTPSNPRDRANPRAVLGYDAYFGRFTVNEAEGTITHHVEGSLFPEDLGSDFKRFFTIDGDTFTLGFTSQLPDGSAIIRTLVFRRSK